MASNVEIACRSCNMGRNEEVKRGKPKTKAKSKVKPQAAFKEQLQELFHLLRAVGRRSCARAFAQRNQVLVARLETLEIRMDANKNHGKRSRPYQIQKGRTRCFLCNKRWLSLSR